MINNKLIRKQASFGGAFLMQKNKPRLGEAW